MKTSLERIEENKIVMEVTVEAVDLDKAMAKAYKEIGQKIVVPGFRKGKVPRKLIETRIGIEAVVEEAIDLLLPDAYAQAVEEAKIKPIDRPEVKVIQAEPGKPMVFKATVQVEPEAELGEYLGIEAEPSVTTVTPEDVQKGIETIRERAATMTAITDRAVAAGDYTTIDFEGFVAGVPFEGGSAKDFELNIGSGAFIPGFEDQLIGAERNEPKAVLVKFPEDYHSADLAGKEAEFKVTVKEIKQKVLPALNDEFARTVSEHDTYEALKNEIENRLKQMAADNAKRKLENQIVSQVVNNAKVEIPAVMTERRVDRMMQDMAAELEQQGTTIEKYCEYMQKTPEEVRADFHPGVEREIKTDLVLEKVAKVANLMVTPEEMDAEIARLAIAYKQEPAILRQRFAEQGTMEMVEESLVLRKAVDFLVQNAKIKQIE